MLVYVTLQVRVPFKINDPGLPVLLIFFLWQFSEVLVFRPVWCSLYFLFSFFFGPNCICLCLHCSFMFRAYSPPVNQLHSSWCAAEQLPTSPLMCLYQMNVAYYRRDGVSWVALWTQKRGPARDHERDIVHCGPYSCFVDKWIFMLIKWDSGVNENCGECGIILTIRPNTRRSVDSSVWSFIVLQLELFRCYILS